MLCFDCNSLLARNASLAVLAILVPSPRCELCVAVARHVCARQLTSLASSVSFGNVFVMPAAMRVPCFGSAAAAAGVWESSDALLGIDVPEVYNTFRNVIVRNGALGGSFNFGWIRVLGREGYDSTRCMPPVLVEVTAVM